MNKMNNIKYAVAVALVSFALAGSALAASNTLGQTVTQTLFGDTNQNIRVETVRQDQSRYPSQDGRRGTVVRSYDADLDGVPSAGGVVFVQLSNTSSSLGFKIPSNTIVAGYVLDITRASGATTQTFSLGLNAAGDLLAATTNFGVTTPRAAVINPPIKATNDVYLLFGTGGGAMTNLSFTVTLDAIKGQ